MDECIYHTLSQSFNHNGRSTVLSRNGRNKCYCASETICVREREYLVLIHFYSFNGIHGDSKGNLFVYTSPIIERLHNSVNFHRVNTVNNNTKHERMQKLGILVTTW